MSTLHIDIGFDILGICEMGYGMNYLILKIGLLLIFCNGQVGM